ncbi:hypothetical protein ES703_100636 [subsurface metagenome]
MNRRINTRVVVQATEGLRNIISKDASEIWWVSLSPAALNAIALFSIYDGFDAGGKLVLETHPGYDRIYNFIPPIHCEQGVFVLTDANIQCYTIAWRPKKWDRQKPMKADVIEHPEA